MIPARTTIYVVTGAFDMRRSFDGLAAVVRDVLQLDPLGGALFLFANRSRDRLKLLWFDRSGYCLLYKRLERGGFRLPHTLAAGDTSVAIDAAELARVLEGVALPTARWQPAQAAE